MPLCCHLCAIMLPSLCHYAAIFVPLCCHLCAIMLPSLCHYAAILWHHAAILWHYPACHFQVHFPGLHGCFPTARGIENNPTLTLPFPRINYMNHPIRQLSTHINLVQCLFWQKTHIGCAQLPMPSTLQDTNQGQTTDAI